MEKYKIEQVNIGKKKEGVKNNKPWALWPCGIKVGGEWYNQGIFSEAIKTQIEEMNIGSEYYLELYTEPDDKGGEWKKFKLPGEKEIFTMKFDEFAKDLKDIKEALKIINSKLPLK